VINSAGEAAFTAAVAGPAVTSSNQNGLWTFTSGSPALAVRAGAQAPGTPGGVTFRDFATPNMNATGDIAFRGLLSNIDTNHDEGIWAGRPSTLALVAQDGGPAPGAPEGKSFLFSGGEIEEFYTPYLNAQGKVAFRGVAYDIGNLFSLKTGNWTNAPGALTQIARQGNPAPGGPTPVRFDTIRRPVINAGGTIAFPADKTVVSDLYVGTAGSIAPVAGSGQMPAPGVPGATLVTAYFGASQPGINTAGELAFVGRVAGPGISDNNDNGIWAGPLAGLRLVGREGDSAPGIPGFTFSSFRSPVINHNGQAAFLGQVFGVVNNQEVSRAGYFVGDRQSNLKLVAATGDRAPGTPDGFIFDGLGYDFHHVTDLAPALNSRGEIAFLAFLQGPDVTQDNAIGLWMGDGSSLRLVARDGDVLTVDGAPRTIQTLSLISGSGGEDGHPSGLSDTGQLTFGARFTDGSSAIFVTIIPEPAALFPLVLRALWLTMPRRTRRR
jgi:hypothetical protein